MESKIILQLVSIFALVIGSAVLGFIRPRHGATAPKQPQNRPKPAESAALDHQPAPRPKKRPVGAAPTDSFAAEYAELPEVAAAQENSGLQEQRNPEAASENREIMADFDLRRAVIYSEILKPKFDDENNG